MTRTIRPHVFFTATIVAITTATLLIWGTARANPTMFPPSAYTAVATSTLAYMSPGTATTTLTYDAYGICGTNEASQTLTGADDAQVNLQITASSTGPTINARVEESQDCIDWYPVAVPIANATSTLYTSNPYQNYSLVISTSTVSGYGGSGTSQRVHESFSIPIPERAVRVVFYDPAGGNNYGLWAQIVPSKQQP